MGILKQKKRQLRLFLAGILFVLLASIAPTQKASADPEFFHELSLRIPANAFISDRFTQHRTWLVETFFAGQVLPALMLFTEQLSAVAMQQTMAIGTFLDAKHQLETQRLLQELQFQAHVDYQPSEDFCWFGTNVRSLAATEQKGRTNAYMLARRQTARQMGERSMGAAANADNDKYARWNTFLELFCDPQDSNWLTTKADESGLVSLCTPAPTFSEFTNADIDYSRLIENERTISLGDGLGGFDLVNSNVNGEASILNDDKALMALQNNLYGHEVLARVSNKSDFKNDDTQKWYMALRSVAAKRSVAENSFNAIVGMKSSGISAGLLPGSTVEYLGAIMTELGVPADEVNSVIGAQPSYYAQLELLAKKIYQNPDFYANLYDKPANVKRKSVALKAIELMVDRAIYESQIRQEMLTSVLLSARLHEPFKAADLGL